MLYRIITWIFKIFYLSYLFKYKLSLRNFNGYMIRLSGDGIISMKTSSYISFGSRIHADKDTKVLIGEKVSIGHRAQLYTTSIDTNSHLFGLEKIICGDIVIEDNVIIGYNVFIGPNVIIGKGSVIGANVVLVSSVSEYTIVTSKNDILKVKIK